MRFPHSLKEPQTAKTDDLRTAWQSAGTAPCMRRILTCCPVGGWLEKLVKRCLLIYHNLVYYSVTPVQLAATWPGEQSRYISLPFPKPRSLACRSCFYLMVDARMVGQPSQHTCAHMHLRVSQSTLAQLHLL